MAEIKTMGAWGPCACCGKGEALAGPVSEEELRACRERLERLAAIGAGMVEAGLAVTGPDGKTRLVGE